MFDEIILSLPCALLHHSDDHSNSSVDATPCRRSRTASKTSNCNFNRSVRNPPWHANRSSSIWHSHAIYELAKHILVLIRSTISHPGTPLLLHAGLPKYESSRIELLHNALQHPPNAFQVPRARPSMSCRLLGVFDIYQLLDNPDVPSFFTSLLVRLSHDRSFRTYWYCSNGFGPFLLEGCH